MRRCIWKAIFRRILQFTLCIDVPAANEVENDVYAALYGDDDTAGAQGPQDLEAESQVAGEGEPGHSSAGISKMRSFVP